MTSSRLISIVDDDVYAREGIDNLVTSMGYRTTTFASAEEFLASVALDETACVIADLQMPGLSGLDLQERLISQGYRISFIIITGLPDDRYRTRALASGAAGFLTKPFDDENLRRCLSTAVENID
jgi:FixJ family two-component response regulator